MDVNSIKTKNNFHNYITIKQLDTKSEIELLLCGSDGSILNNLNGACTVTIYDTVSKEVRQISEEMIEEGILKFKITNDLLPRNHKLEVTTFSGIKFPADDDFNIIVSETHNSKLLNIIKSLPTELVAKIVTQQIMDRFNTSDERFYNYFTEFKSSYQKFLFSLNEYVKKGDLSVTDINKSKGLLDASFFTTEFLELLNKGQINATNVLNNSIIESKLADKSVTPRKTTFLKPGTNLYNLKDNIQGGYYTDAGYWAENDTYTSSGFNPIKPNTLYSLNTSTINSHLAFWDKDKKFVSGISAGTWKGTFTSPNASTINYVTFAANKNEDFSKVMLVEGDKLPFVYIPWSEVLEDYVQLNDAQIKPLIKESDINIITSKNIFDYTSMILTGYEIGTNGLIRTSNNSAVVDKLPIDNTKGVLSISGLPIYKDGYNRLYSFNDKNGNPIKTTLTGSDSIYRLNTSATIAIPQNAASISINLHSNKTSNEILDYSKTQIEYSTTATSFSAFESIITSIKGHKIKSGNAGNGLSNVVSGLDLLNIGDSITKTADMNADGSNYVEGVRDNWPMYLMRDLPFNSMKNMAEAGAAWKDRTGVTERQKISTQINAAINQGYKADVIIIAMGTNDGTANMGDYNTAMSKKTIGELDRTNLYEAIRWAFWTIQAHKPWENAIKFVSLPIQRADYEPVQSLHDAIIKMAKRYGFIVIDMNNESQILREFEIWGAEGRDLYDGLHPNSSGQKKMAKVFYKHILNNIK